MRNFIRNIFLKLGWDIRRSINVNAEKRLRQEKEELNKWSVMNKYNPEIILDIGANTGQFAELCRQILPNAEIVSFEPIKECFLELDTKKDILKPFSSFNCALGSENCETIIHRNSFSPSSSLLPIHQSHVDELPQSGITKPETITVKRLDSIYKPGAISKKMLWKIDVQGFTMPVLLGAGELIYEPACIICEISMKTLYKGEAGFDEIYRFLHTKGFIYQGNISQWISKSDHSVLQADCLFENTKVIS